MRSGILGRRREFNYLPSFNIKFSNLGASHFSEPDVATLINYKSRRSRRRRRDVKFLELLSCWVELANFVSAYLGEPDNLISLINYNIVRSGIWSGYFPFFDCNPCLLLGVNMWCSKEQYGD